MHPGGNSFSGVPLASSPFCPLFFWPLPSIAACLVSFSSPRPCGCSRVQVREGNEEDSPFLPSLHPPLFPQEPCPWGSQRLQQRRTFGQKHFSFCAKEQIMASLLAFLGALKNQSEEWEEGNSMQPTELSVLGTSGEEGAVVWTIQTSG